MCVQVMHVISSSSDIMTMCLRLLDVNAWPKQWERMLASSVLAWSRFLYRMERKHSIIWFADMWSLSARTHCQEDRLMSFQPCVSEQTQPLASLWIRPKSAHVAAANGNDCAVCRNLPHRVYDATHCFESKGLDLIVWGLQQANGSCLVPKSLPYGCWTGFY